MSRHRLIPRYFLYGDAEEDTERDFLHCEAIATRSGANNWIIRPHAHPAHVQILFVSQGGGDLNVEGISYPVQVPSLLVVPAGMVHDIRFDPGTNGNVITAAAAYVAWAARDDKRLIAQTLEPGAFSLDPAAAETRRLGEAFEHLGAEFVWTAPGRRPAILADFLHILVAIMRLRQNQQSALPSDKRHHRDYDLVMRFRELIEEHFRTEKRLAFFASRMGVTAARLNAACRAIAGNSAARLLHERLIIEAKRYLLYTGMSVGEVGHTLGFEDPAYFNRFFAERAGCPPGAFREAARTGNSA